MSSAPPVRVFYSYAHEDEKLRDKLEQHLSPLMRQGLIQPWYDRDIRAGSEWRTEIDKHLDEAQLILLLISPAFIHSNFCYTIELPRAMERHHNGEARVIPIHIEPVDWQGTLFARLQALPAKAKAVTEWRLRNRAFKTVAQGIRRAEEEIQGISQSTPIIHAPLTPKASIRPTWLWAAAILLIILLTMTGIYQYTRHIQPVNRLLANGERFLSTGRYEQAQTVYQTAFQYGWYGKLAAKFGLEKARVYDFDPSKFDVDIAAQRTAHIFKQRRHDPHAYLFQGDLAYIDKDFEQAITSYRQALQHDPALPQVYFNLGVVYTQLGHTETALEMYEKAADLAPRYSPYLNNLAHAYAQHGRKDDALGLYERVLNLSPNLLIIHFDLAQLYHQWGMPDNALSHLQQGVGRLDDPEIAELESNQQPWSFTSLDDPSETLPLHGLARKRCYGYRALAETLRVLGQADAAAAYERKPCDLPPGDTEVIESWVKREIRRFEP